MGLKLREVLLRMLRYPGPEWLNVLMCEQCTDVRARAAGVPSVRARKKTPAILRARRLRAGPY